MSRSDRRGRVLGAAATALLVAAVAPAPAAAPAPPPSCLEVLVSPAYRVDRTLVCVHRDGDGLRVLSVSRDAGRSWRRAAMAGVLRPAGPAGAAMSVTVSPAFAADKSLFATTGSGTFVSKDLGATFTVVDTLTQGTVEGNPVAFVGTPQPLPMGDTGRRLLLAYAGPPTPALIDPAAGTRRVALGVPGRGAALFAVPPSSSAPAGALAVVNEADLRVAGTTRARLFRCDAALTCAEPLFAFPPGSYFGPTSRLLLHPDNSVVALVSDGDVLQPWRSTDGGVTFSLWEPLARMLAAVTWPGPISPRVAIATSSAAPRRVYVRIEASMPSTRWPKGSAPASQIYRSDDAGATWRRVAWARIIGQPGPPGNAPWISSRGELQVTPDGRLLASGSSERLSTTWCSLDGGKRWYAGCPR